MRGSLRLAGGVALAVMAFAMASRGDAAEILHAPDAIRACLCRDQAVTALSDTLNRESEAYEQRRRELAELDSRAATARQQLDPADAGQREALGRLLDERDAAQRDFASETTPHYNATVALYNEAADAFNRDCGGKAYDWDVLPQVQSTLSCPAVPAIPAPRP